MLTKCSLRQEKMNPYRRAFRASLPPNILGYLFYGSLMVTVTEPGYPNSGEKPVQVAMHAILKTK